MEEDDFSVRWRMIFYELHETSFLILPPIPQELTPKTVEEYLKTIKIYRWSSYTVAWIVFSPFIFVRIVFFHLLSSIFLFRYTPYLASLYGCNANRYAYLATTLHLFLRVPCVVFDVLKNTMQIFQRYPSWRKVSDSEMAFRSFEGRDRILFHTLRLFLVQKEKKIHCYSCGEVCVTRCHSCQLLFPIDPSKQEMTTVQYIVYSIAFLGILFLGYSLIVQIPFISELVTQYPFFVGLLESILVGYLLASRDLQARISSILALCLIILFAHGLLTSQSQATSSLVYTAGVIMGVTISKKPLQYHFEQKLLEFFHIIFLLSMTFYLIEVSSINTLLSTFERVFWGFMTCFLLGLSIRIFNLSSSNRIIVSAWLLFIVAKTISTNINIFYYLFSISLMTLFLYLGIFAQSFIKKSITK